MSSETWSDPKHRASFSFPKTYTVTKRIWAALCVLSKPWITSDTKKLLVEKEQAFKVNDRSRGKLSQREIQSKINCNNNLRMVWRGIKTMIGQSNQPKIPEYSIEEANALNKYFARLESGLLPFPSWLDNVTDSTSIMVCSRDVEQVFSQAKPCKAAGPDKLLSMVLRTCYEQLSHFFSFVTCSKGHWTYIWHPKVVKQLKFSLPEKPKLSVLNDFRLVALTSVVIKCLEWIVLTHL